MSQTTRTSPLNPCSPALLPPHIRVCSSRTGRSFWPLLATEEPGPVSASRGTAPRPGRSPPPGAVDVARDGPAKGGRRRRLQHRGEQPRAPPRRAQAPGREAPAAEPGAELPASSGKRGQAPLRGISVPTCLPGSLLPCKNLPCP